MNDVSLKNKIDRLRLRHQYIALKGQVYKETNVQFEIGPGEGRQPEYLYYRNPINNSLRFRIMMGYYAGVFEYQLNHYKVLDGDRLIGKHQQTQHFHVTQMCDKIKEIFRDES